VKPVDSDVLSGVIPNLGLTGGAQETQFDDENLSQFYDVGRDVRRKRAPAPAWWYGILQNTHSAADAEMSTINPYSVGTTLAGHAEWTEISNLFDVWLISLQAIRLSGAGLPTAVFAAINPIRTHLAWGKDDGGSVVTTHHPYVIARWDSVDAGITGLTNDPLLTEQGGTTVVINQRFPRGAALEFSSEADAACVLQLIAVLGLFPVGLGQDIAY